MEMTATEEKLIRLNQEVVQLYQEAKYSEAIQLGKQALEMGKIQLGIRHPNTTTAINNLALLYDRVGDHSSAEPLRQWGRQLLTNDVWETQSV